MNPGTTIPPRASINRVSGEMLTLSLTLLVAVAAATLFGGFYGNRLFGSPVQTAPFTMAMVKAAGCRLVLIDVAPARKRAPIEKV